MRNCERVDKGRKQNKVKQECIEEHKEAKPTTRITRGKGAQSW